jgi:hypothetical protein
VTQASPDILYLNYYSASNGAFGYAAGSTQYTRAINNTTPSFSWYSDVCPSGATDGSIAAGAYSATVYYSQLPNGNKSANISLSVGHVNSTGGDFQAITSTSTTLNRNTPSPSTYSLGSGPALSCTAANPRRLVFTITYLSGDDRTIVAYNGGGTPSYLSTPAIVVPEFGLILGGPIAFVWYLVKKKKIKIRK